MKVLTWTEGMNILFKDKQKYQQRTITLNRIACPHFQIGGVIYASNWNQSGFPTITYYSITKYSDYFRRLFWEYMGSNQLTDEHTSELMNETL